MNKHQRQYQIRENERRDTKNTDDWLAANGINAATFATTHVRLLQALQQSHVLLTQHRQLLTQQQQEMLEQFLQLMANKRTRERLNPKAANPILNISSKINRQLFKQYRQLTKA